MTNTEFDQATAAYQARTREIHAAEHEGDRPAEYAGMSIPEIWAALDEYEQEAVDALTYLRELIRDTPEWRF